MSIEGDAVNPCAPEERNVYSQGQLLPINQSPRNGLAKSEPSGFYN